MNVRLASFCMIFCFTNCIAKGNLKESIFIGQSAVGGMRGYDYIIARDEQNLSKTALDLQIDGLFLKKCIVKDSVYNLLQNFLQKKCIPINTENEYTYNFVRIQLFNKTGEQVCYLVDKGEIQLYFNTLKNEIQKNINAQDNKCILEIFDQILAIVDYDPRIEKTK